MFTIYLFIPICVKAFLVLNIKLSYMDKREV